MKKVFKKKSSSARRRRWMTWLQQNGFDKATQPPRPNFTRWTVWYKCIVYYLKYFDCIGEFLDMEAEKTTASYIDGLRDILNIPKNKQHLLIELNFISENAHFLTSCISFFETKNEPVAQRAFNALTDLHSFLQTGADMKGDSGAKTDALLSQLSNKDKAAWKKSFQVIDCHYTNIHVTAHCYLFVCLFPFQDAFNLGKAKLEKHMDRQVILDTWKATRCFDPLQMKSFIASGKADFSLYAKPLQMKDNMDSRAQWRLYLAACERGDLPDARFEGTQLSDWWTAMKSEFPAIAQYALDYIWIPVSSAEVERSYSAFKNLFSDKRQNLTQSHVADYLFMMYNKVQ